MAQITSTRTYENTVCIVILLPIYRRYEVFFAITFIFKRGRKDTLYRSDKSSIKLCYIPVTVALAKALLHPEAEIEHYHDTEGNLIRLFLSRTFRHILHSFHFWSSRMRDTRPTVEYTYSTFFLLLYFETTPRHTKLSTGITFIYNSRQKYNYI